MKKAAILLIICVIFSGYPAEASLIPVGCPAMEVQSHRCVPAKSPSQNHKCCKGTCDCSIETHAKDLFKYSESFKLDTKLLISQTALLVEKNTESSDTFRLNSEKTPPKNKDRLYDLYSDYRI